jgi:hypothetical protein
MARRATTPERKGLTLVLFLKEGELLEGNWAS